MTPEKLFSQFLTILEGNSRFAECCRPEFLESLNENSRQLVERGHFVRFLFENDAETCEQLAREIAAFRGSVSALFEAQNPEEAAEIRRLMDALERGEEI